MPAIHNVNNPLKTQTHELPDSLILKNNKPATTLQIEYSFNHKLDLIGTSLLSLADSVARAVINTLSLIRDLITLGYWQKEPINLNQFHVITAERTNLVEPKGALTPEIRSQRIRQGSTLIAAKLQKQFERAQNQAAQEPDKEFQYLPAPNNFKGHSHTEKTSNYDVGVCHFIGRRPTMEDEHLATSFDLNVSGKIYPIQLFGIFDGHGGNAASIYIKEHLEQELHKTLNEFCLDGLTDEAIWNALKMTFVRLKEKFTEPQSGTTATVAIILDEKLWTANVGDSRTILDNGIQLSEDAKPEDPYYKKGIENRGGRVFFNRVNGNLAVARAIGDHNVGAISARPKITAYPISMIPKGSHLILTCDGIYDVSSTRKVASAVQAHKDQPVEELAKNIVYSAFKAGSTDNLSALVVKLRTSR